jgi:hypothetical protein
MMVAGTLLCCAAAAPPAAAKADCTRGRFVVDGGDLFERARSPVRPAHATDGASHGRVVTLAAGEIAIAGVCPATTATLRHGRRRTRVGARWEACDGIAGRVRLKGTIDADGCATLRGQVRARRAKVRRRFRAARSLGDPANCTGEDTFTVIQQRIFGAKGCRVSTCHGEFKAGGLDLRWGAAHFSLVGRPATTAAAAGRMLVMPGDADASFLWHKLAGTLGPGEGARMPAAGSPPLDALELELVRAWIEAGAPAVDEVPEAPCLPHREFQPAAALLPPPGGYQMVLEGPTLQPGEEMEGCMWVRAPNPTDFAVGKWEYSLNPGTHHFALWDHRHGPTPSLDEFDPADLACIRRGASPEGITISGAGEAPYFVDSYPAGVGRVIEAGKIIGLNPHYFNEFDVPIQVRVWINMHPVQGPFEHEVQTLFSGDGLLAGKSVYNIFVPPFSEGTLRLRYQNTLGRALSIFELSSHQHQRGTQFTAWDSSGRKIFENFDWAHPTILNFDEPYVLAPGDFIDYECRWDNGITREVRRCGDARYDGACTPGEPRPVTFGVTAQDEMCYLTGFYYVE